MKPKTVKKVKKARPLGSTRSRPMRGHPSATRVDPKTLHLDPQNPRFADTFDRAPSEHEMIAQMVREHTVERVGASLARYGFFDSEPLVVVDEAGRSVVVEGNRRLTAIRLLTNSAVRAALTNERLRKKWDTLAKSAGALDHVWIVRKPDRAAANPLLGFRHIAGIEPWDPWAQASFIANLVDRDKASFEHVSELTGLKIRSVREEYRNYWITKRARAAQIDVKPVRREFGKFNRAMQVPEIRVFIQVPDGRDVGERKTGALLGRPNNFRELVGFVFGYPPKKHAVITDTRQLRDLGEVLGDPRAKKKLRESRDLEAAHALTGAPDRAYLRALRRAQRAIQAAIELREDVRDLNPPKRLEDLLERAAKEMQDFLAAHED